MDPLTTYRPVATYRDWHEPQNEDCLHNHDPITQPCTCKRKLIRKPFRVVRVRDANVGHGIRPELSIEVYPNGRLVIREAGRRMRVEATLGAVYEQCLMRDARRVVFAKRKAKQERRKVAKIARRAK
jgi:hypothetical protein